MNHNCGPILTKATWRLLPFMFILYVLSYLDRINVSFAGLQMNKDLGFDDSIFGFGAGIFFLGYFAFGIPSNLMVERFGARRWISIIMVIWGVISMAMATVSDPMSFYVLRFLLGVAEAGFFPGMILYLTYWFPKRERGMAVAKFMTAIPVAGVLGGLVSAKLLAMHGLYGMPGWKWLFLWTGAPSVVFGILVWFYLVDGPHSAKWLSDDERTSICAMLAADREEHEGSGGAKLVDALKSPTIWMFALIYFSLTLGMYGFQLWLPQIIHNFGGLDDSQTALLSAIPAVFQALGMVIIAWSSDKRGERRIHVAASCCVAAGGLLISAFSHDPVVSMAALSLSAFGIWGVVGPFWALPTAALPPSLAAAGIALINSVGNLGGFAGPFLVGAIKEQTKSFELALSAMALSLILGGVITLYTGRNSAPAKAPAVVPGPAE